MAGALANKPGNGGEAWVRLSWVLGLRRLGFDVCFVEHLRPAACVDAEGRPASLDASTNLRWFDEVTRRFGLVGSSALVYDDGASVVGMDEAELLERAEAAELLVNISGHLDVLPLLRRLRRKAYVDIDPGFTQLWHLAGDRGARLEGHDAFFTIAENIGTRHCSLPTGGVPWRPTRQPVVLDDWLVTEGEEDRFTTVARWRGPFGPVSDGERTYGLKVHEFRKLAPLPGRAAQRFEIALDIHPADAGDRDLLTRHGWHLVDPVMAAGDPDRFRTYVQGSGAECSAAAGVYVDTRSGWFSDRTVRYLASGKPALVQDTGFGHTLPVGEGLVPFRDLDEAVQGAAAIGADYRAHCEASRRIAEECFDSDVVLARLLDEVGVAP